MRSSLLMQHVKLAILAKRAVFIWGDPGVGKTELVYGLEKEMGFDGVLDFRLALKQDVDLMGIPRVAKHADDGQDATFWNPPAELPRKGRWIIFIDEFCQGQQATQNAATSLVLDRRLGSYVLPDECVIIAASNLDTNRAGTNRMTTQVASRFVHFTLQVHTQDWLDWAHANDVDPRVIAFIKYRPEFLQKFDARSLEKAYACPRTWKFLSDILKQIDAAGMRFAADEMLESVAGVVGKESAAEFVGFCRIMEKLVSIDSIMLDPERAALPDDSAITYALTYALADRADRKLLPVIAKYIGRLQEEWQFLFYREVRDRKADLMKTKVFIEWAAAHHDFA